MVIQNFNPSPGDRGTKQDLLNLNNEFQCSQDYVNTLCLKNDIWMLNLDFTQCLGYLLLSLCVAE